MENEKKKSGFATAGLVVGIIGICTSFIPFINNLSFILGLIGILFAIVSLIKKASKGTAIAAIVVCILTMYFTIQSQQALSDSFNETFNEIDSNLDDMTGDNTEKILADSCDVVLGEFELKKGEYGINESRLPVTVTNKELEKKSFSIEIEAIKEDGSRIKTDYVYANDLGAGQSQTFNIFEYVSEEEYDTMKNAKFNIFNVSMY